jgi:hypothetical protein
MSDPCRSWQVASLSRQPIANRRYLVWRRLPVRCVAGCQPAGHLLEENMKCDRQPVISEEILELFVATGSFALAARLAQR